MSHMSELAVTAMNEERERANPVNSGDFARELCRMLGIELPHGTESLKVICETGKLARMEISRFIGTSKAEFTRHFVVCEGASTITDECTLCHGSGKYIGLNGTEDCTGCNGRGVR